MPILTVKVDPAACTGISSCVDTAPVFFKIDRENRAGVRTREDKELLPERTLDLSEEEAQLVLQAAESCPMVAISVFDESGDQLYG
jgi:ferredoxin